MSLREHIRQQLPALSPALQQVARLVLDRPNDVVTTSMRAVGARAGLPPATLVRFAQQMGFAGWPELKAAAAAELGLGPEPYADRARALVGRARDHTLVHEMFDVHRHNLDATERHNTTTLPRACAVLEKARTVHVAGYRACYPIAFSFAYLYRLFRPTVQVLDGPGGSLEMQQRAIAKGDALLVISFAPYSREALQAVEAARRAGARIVALTDSEASPLSLVADETLLFAIRSPSFFPSVAAGMALAEALIELLASRAGKGVVPRIDAAEAQLFESGAYLEPPTPARLRTR